MNGYDLAIARQVIEHAARRAPTHLSQRLLEEWMADLSERRGRMARLRLALGCYWAAILIEHDASAMSAPATISPVGHGIMITDARHGPALFARQAAAPRSGPVMCEINTTPLIDVLLVLLVTLIITLPMMTQAVRLDLPQSPPRDEAPPEVINLDIDFDGAVSEWLTCRKLRAAGGLLPRGKPQAYATRDPSAARSPCQVRCRGESTCGGSAQPADEDRLCR